MLSLILSLLAGTALGVLTGLGLGGGSLLLLWLTLICSFPPETARSISLLFFFPGALISCFLNRRRIPFRKLLPAMVFGTAAAGLFSLLSPILGPDRFRPLLGLLLMAAGLGQIFH